MKDVPETKALIIAPHNDDEILGAGGIIQRYLGKDGHVLVAMITNGDGQRRRPPLIPRADFVKLGYRRQRESLESLKVLGLSPEDVFFLGYPDRGLSKLWSTHWGYDRLFPSKYTRTDHSPYENSFTPKAPYCGLSLACDLQQIISDTNPDVIYLPHPNDSHTDHWSTNAFVIYSLEQLKERREGEFDQITLLTYLIHRGRWPLPRGKNLNAELAPPKQLLTLDTKWIRIPLNQTESMSKFSAICKHRSQTQLMKKYLMSFARANELFGVIPTLVFEQSLEFLDSNDLIDFPISDNEPEDEAFLSYLDPKQKSIMASLKRYTDIKSVNLTKKDGMIEIGVNFFNRLRSANEVRIHINPLAISKKNSGNTQAHIFERRRNKLYRNEKIVPQSSSIKSSEDANSFTLILSLPELGNPNKLLIGVELLRKGITFAKSAHRLIEFK